MSSAFSIALTGLEANSQGINTAGNNLANMNTDGFKETQIDFKDLFNESLGTGLQVGLGVTSTYTNQIFSQGSIQVSESPYAAAIQGNGFFVVSNANESNLLTRDGNFVVTSQGVLQTQTGENVQGWTATSSGLNTTGPTGNITIPTGAALPPVATQNFAVNANLNAQAVAGTANATFTTPIQVYDSLGNTHDLTITFTRSSTSANTWGYDITIPGADLAAGTSGQQQSVATGSVSFNNDGSLSTAGGTAAVPISITGLADGAADLSINWNLFTNGIGSLTQYAETSNSSGSTQDGNAPSEATSVSIQNGGQVVTTYSGGQTKVEAQLAMAVIQNPNSLENVGNNNFSITAASALPAIGVPQTGGRGQILGSSIESSNVDIATEFTNLIVYQTGYQASSRVISTEQTITNDLFSLIH
jgi:flagellar hook protein FlgE